MIENPENYIEKFAKAGADIIVIHAESTVHIHRQIQLIKSLGVKAGIALNPATSIEFLDYILEDLDLVLFMSVNPGFSGQSFIPSTLDKIDQFNIYYQDRLKKDFLIQVDGGVNDKTVKSLTDKGVNMLVSGNYFFKHPDRKEAIKILKS
jgi:ribulose-phosphate 3-epimerase